MSAADLHIIELRTKKGKGAGFRCLLLTVVLVRLFGVPGTLDRLIGGMVTSPLTALVYAMMAAYVTWHFLVNGAILKTKITFPFFSVVLFFLCIGISSFISQYVPSSGLWNVSRLALLALFAFSVADSFNLENLLKSVFIAVAIVFLCCSLAFFLPGYGFVDYETTRAFTGIWTTKNVCAGFIAFCILFLLGLLVYLPQDKSLTLSIPRWILVLMLLGFGGMLLSADALGGLICTVVPAAFVVLDRRGVLSLKRKGTFWVLLSVGFLLFATAILPLFSDVLAIWGKTSDLTGRTTIWKSISQLVLETSPLFGFGYGDFWSEESPVYFLIKSVYAANGLGAVHTGSHNAIVELLLMFGLTGVLSYLLMLAVVFDKSRYAKNQMQNQLISAFLAYFMLYCLAERSLSYIGLQTFVLFLCIAVILASFNAERENPQ